jgi:hypothetical protein
MSKQELAAKCVSDRDYFEVFVMTWPETAGGSEREMWTEYRDELLAEYVSHFPGYRPPAWWRWDSPEPRLRLGGIGEVIKDGEMHLGTPRNWASIDKENPPEYESQPQYLRRLGLFLQAEESRLVESDFGSDVMQWDESEEQQ